MSANDMHITIDVVVTDDEICGQIRDDMKQPTSFSGWLGLLGALDGLLGTSTSGGSEPVGADR